MMDSASSRAEAPRTREPLGGRRSAWEPLGPRERIIAVAAWAGFAVVLGFLAFSRSYPGMLTETDFLGGFLRDALQFRQGGALEVDFQPPLYPALLALGYFFHPDWFRVGLALSWFGMVASLGVAFVFFRRLLGPVAGWGAAVGLATSATALAFGAQATSDAPFLLLYSAAVLLALFALHAPNPRTLFLLLGLSIAAALLFRFNGLPLVALALVLFLRDEAPRLRVGNAFALLAGAAILIGSWGGYAAVTGSPFYPTENYLNLGMTYFGEGDRIGRESRLDVEARFSGTWDVVTHDPPALAAQYARDLIYLPQRLLQTDQTDFLADGLVAFPLGLLALPGVVLLFMRRASPFAILFLVVTLGHVLLLNLKTYDPRFYLFLVPVLGAGAAFMVTEMGRLLPHRWQRWVSAAGLVLLVLVGARVSLLDAQRALTIDQAELSEAVPRVMGVVDEDDIVVARKRHVPLYAGSDFSMIPESETVEELIRHLRRLDPPGGVYLYFGRAEATYRSSLRELSSGFERADLEPVLRGAEAEWTLYRLRPRVPE